eukprot:s6_g28.t1
MAVVDQPSDWSGFVSAAYTKAGFSSEKSKEFYNETAEIYDKLAHPEVWLAPKLATEHALALIASATVRILDFGAGTGQLTLRLREAGFENVDAVEPAEAMLAQVPAGTFQNTFPDTAQAPDAAYDLIVSTGVIGTHVGPEGVKDLMSKVRSGGDILFTCKFDTYEQLSWDAAERDHEGRTWRRQVLQGPLPLNRDMPSQEHVIVRLACET